MITFPTRRRPLPPRWARLLATLAGGPLPTRPERVYLPGAVTQPVRQGEPR